MSGAPINAIDALTALCFRATCRQLPEVEAGAVPDWIEVIPAGQDVVGRDGRSFKNSTPDVVVAASSPTLNAIPVDYEHGTEIPQASNGRAAGWVTDIESRKGGSIWVKVDWTPAGRKSIQDREYRFVSPAFFHNKEGQVLKLVSVGLTNSPNLKLSSLNTTRPLLKEEEPMPKKIFSLLGVKDEAAEDDAVEALNAILKERDEALNRASSPSLDTFVPRDDYNLAVNRAQTAEEKLAEYVKATKQKDIDAAIEQALKERKITPAQKDYHRAQCETEGGLERFKAFCDIVTPVIAEGDAISNTKPSSSKSLNQLQLDVIERTGLSPEQFLAAGGKTSWSH